MGSDSEKGKYLSPNGSRTWEYLATLACSLYAFCIGTSIGWMSPSLMKLAGPHSPIEMTTSGSSTVVAAIAVGHAVAPFISNPMIDRLGRKNTIFIGGIPLIISWSMIFIAKHIWILIVARFLAGLSLGFAICATPIYIGEIASVHLRGTISSTFSVMVNIGILFAYVIIPYLSVATTALVCLTISVITQIALWLAPESPYYLMLAGRVEDAEATLEKLRGKHDVSEELNQMKISMLDSASHKISIGTSLRSLFMVKKNLRAFAITSLLVVTHHFGGLVILVVFAHRIFEDAETVVSNNYASLAIAGSKLLSAVLSTFMVDRAGRRPLILIGSVMATLSDFTIGGYFYAKEYMNLDVSGYSLVPLIASMTLVFAFNIGLVGVQAVLTGELFSVDVKAMGSCLTGVIGGMLGGISAKMYLIIVDSWGMGHSVPFIGFAVVVFVSSFIILCLTPETKGKTFVEIQQALSK